VKIRPFLMVLCLTGLAMLGICGTALGSSKASPMTATSPLAPGRAAVPPGPAARALATPAGPYTIGGTVLDYDGTPISDAWVDWYWFDPNAPAWFGPDVVYHSGGSTETAAGGAFSFADVTSVPGSDALSAWSPYSTDHFMISTWSNDFSTQDSYVLRPGRVPVTISNLPLGESPQVTVGDVTTGSAESQPQLTEGHGLASTAAPGFRTAVVERRVTWGVHAALDWTSPGGVLVSVTPGTTADQEIVLDWSEARHGFVSGTRWQHAARPGDVVTFVLKDWPAGYQASFLGTSWGDEETILYYEQTVTSAGADHTYRVSLRLPRNLPMDDLYELAAYRSDAPATLLWFRDYVQPCRFRATQTAIRRGEAVQLRGLILGNSRRVDLLERHTSAGQPSGPAARGWRKVATLHADKDGRFHTSCRPSRTTWYVARIHGYYFRAYTPVAKVRVR
jgi:hypothetical protein